MRGKDRSFVVAFGLACLVGGGSCLAQSDSSPDAEGDQYSLDEETVLAWEPPEYTLQVEPMLWRPALQGDVSLPGSGSKVDVEDLNIDEPQLAPFVEVTYRSDAWQVRASGFGFENDTTHRARRAINIGELSIAEDERVNSEFDLFSAQLVVAKRIWRRSFDAEHMDSGVALSLDLGLGARVFDYELDIDILGGDSQSDDQFFWHPMIGSKLSIDMYDDFTIDVDINFGYMEYSDTSAAALDILVGFQWHITENIGTQMGYRFLYMDLEDGSSNDRLEFDGALAGLYWSLVIRF